MLKIASNKEKNRLLFDHLPEEREGTVLGKYFSHETLEGVLYNVFDTPGSQKYSKNKLASMAMGDIAVCCIRSERGIFDQSFYGFHSLREELMFARTQGLQSLIFLTTFMDTIAYSEDKFIFMVEQLTKLAFQVGFKTEQVQVSPGFDFEQS